MVSDSQLSNKRDLSYFAVLCLSVFYETLKVTAFGGEVPQNAARSPYICPLVDYGIYSTFFIKRSTLMVHKITPEILHNVRKRFQWNILIQESWDWQFENLLKS